MGGFLFIMSVIFFHWIFGENPILYVYSVVGFIFLWIANLAYVKKFFDKYIDKD